MEEVKKINKVKHRYVEIGDWDRQEDREIGKRNA